MGAGGINGQRLISDFLGDLIDADFLPLAPGQSGRQEQ